MDVLETFLTCYELLTDPITDLELDLELTDKFAEKCTEYLKGKNPPKPRFQNIDKYTKNEIVIMDDPLPSPNVDYVLQVAADRLISKMRF